MGKTITYFLNSTPMKKSILNCVLVLSAIYFGFLFVADVVKTDVFIHPEVIDKYPIYLRYSGVKNEIGKPFDCRPGEGAVKDGMYGNPLSDDINVVSRTRNLNYLVDYFDALFTKYVTIRLGMFSHVLFSFLTGLFFYFGISEIETASVQIKLALSSFVLCLPHILSANCVLYRSGKIITAFYIAYLFWLLGRIISKRIDVNQIIVSIAGSCLLILADEMAVALSILFIGLLFILKFYRYAYLYSISIFWYLAFRFFVEPALAYYFNGIHLILFGGYSDFNTFLLLNLGTYVSTLKMLIYHLKMIFGTANYLGSVIFGYINAVVGLAIFMSIIYLNRHEIWEKKSQFLKSILIITGMILYWTFVVYLMALRHPFIISEVGRIGEYYFLPSVILAYSIVLFVIIRLKHNEFLIVTVLLVAATGNFYNTRQTRSAILSQVLGADWVEVSGFLRESIATQKTSRNQIYLKYQKVLDSYQVIVE